MALFREGDVVAVSDTESYDFAYGRLVHAGYGLDLWTVEFEDGMLDVSCERIREDERE